MAEERDVETAYKDRESYRLVPSYPGDLCKLGLPSV